MTENIANVLCIVNMVYLVSAVREDVAVLCCNDKE